MAHDHDHERDADHSGPDHPGQAHPAHPHGDHSLTIDRTADERSLKIALAAILAFMSAEIAVAILASSLALLSDAAHMLTDAAALAMALVAARLASRPAKGVWTFGLGRAEIISASANGTTLLVLALMIVYGAIDHLVSPPHVDGGPVLAVALAGIVVNLVLARVLHPSTGHSDGHQHSLNVEGSFQHILTDLFGFVATAIAAGVILATGFARADAIASLLIAAIMLRASYGLLRASVRVMMEAAPTGIEPELVGQTLASQPGVAEVHDLHVWEVTSGFPAVSAHIVVDAGHECHELRRELARLLEDRFGLAHSTLQVEHARAEQEPLQIEVPSGRQVSVRSGGESE